MFRLLILLACLSAIVAVPAIPMENSMSTKQLEAGDVGPYAELDAMPNPDKLVLLYIPSLSALLERARTLKGSELSEEEISAITSNASVTALPESVASSVLESRGGVR